MILLDTNCVYPEHPVLVGTTQVLQCDVGIVRDPYYPGVQDLGVDQLRVAPNVGQSLARLRIERCMVEFAPNIFAVRSKKR